MKCARPECVAEFEPRKAGKPQKYCSEHCGYLVFRDSKRAKRIGVSVVCAWDGCGKTFDVRVSGSGLQASCCSPKCGMMLAKKKCKDTKIARGECVDCNNLRISPYDSCLVCLEKKRASGKIKSKEGRSYKRSLGQCYDCKEPSLSGHVRCGLHLQLDNRRNVISHSKNLKYMLASRLRGRFNKAVRHNAKAGSAVRDLGCSIEEFKSYLESKFQPGMTWDNWGLKGWHIDHIKPLAMFDLGIREDVVQACHYTNLQPLWWQKNLEKGNRVA